jgi:hypothetical protein
MLCWMAFVNFGRRGLVRSLLFSTLLTFGVGSLGEDNLTRYYFRAFLHSIPLARGCKG